MLNKAAHTLAALMLGTTLTAANAAGSQESCLQTAADTFHPGTVYLAHKNTMMGATIAFAVPNTLTLPSTARHGLHPIFTKSATGIVTMSTGMDNLFFYDVHPYSLNKEGAALKAENFDEIGSLRSAQNPELRVDEARSATITPGFRTFVDTVRTCLKPA